MPALRGKGFLRDRRNSGEWPILNFASFAKFRVGIFADPKPEQTHAHPISEEDNEDASCAPGKPALRG